MTGTEELRSEKSQSQGAHGRFFLIFIREGQVRVVKPNRQWVKRVKNKLNAFITRRLEGQGTSYPCQNLI